MRLVKSVELADTTIPIASPPLCAACNERCLRPHVFLRAGPEAPWDLMCRECWTTIVMSSLLWFKHVTQEETSKL